jgi:serine/threonine-protein kinase HipA
VRVLKRREPDRFDVLENPIGEEAQVDFGQGAPTLYRNGKYRRPYLFCMTLKYSGKAFRKVLWKAEDFCQVAGLPHTKKYENEGGRSMRDILNELARVEHPASDQQRFMLSQLAFWMLAATDGHAKNFSIYHHRGGSFGLTPLYDVLSTWPVVGKRADQLDIHELKLAMALRGKSVHYKIVEIQPRHFQALANQYPGAEAWPAMIDLAGRVEGAIEGVTKRLPKGFKESVWVATSKGMLKQAKSFLTHAKV